MEEIIGKIIRRVLIPIYMITIVVLASQHKRPPVLITFDEKAKIFQAEIAIRADEIAARNKRGGMRLKEPEHKAQTLDDGVQGDAPIEDLMEGFRGFL